MKARRMPDGQTQCVDADTYCDAWSAWAAPLVAATGWQIIGYNPGYLFDTGDGTVTLSAADVHRLVQAIGGAK